MTTKPSALIAKEPKKQWHRHIGTIVAAIIFIAAMWVLRLLVQEMHLSDVIVYMHQLSNASIVLAITFTILSHGVLTLYDLLSVQYSNSRLSYRIIAPISFSAFAIGHNLGLATVSGGAIRYRAYSMLGLGNGQIAKIVLLIPVTFALGASLMVGGVFILEPHKVLLSLPFSSDSIRTIGIVLVALVLSYVVVAYMIKLPLRIKSLEFSFLARQSQSRRFWWAG